MCRSDVVSVSLPVRRSTGPEIFTFDRVPAEPVLPQCARPRRRRVARVLYPSSSRRYLPRAEHSPAKRWLVALCLVVLLQIYSEDDVTVVEGASEAREVLPFASAEESARLLTAPRGEENSTPARSLRNLCSWWSRTTCPGRTSARTSERTQSESARWEREAREQSARNGGYVVALLYPVYHTLGSEQ